MKEKLNKGYFIAIAAALFIITVGSAASSEPVQIQNTQILGFGIKDLVNIGTLGSGIFFISWILQSYESKKNGKSTVSARFWILRLFGLALVLIYSIQIHNLLFILTNAVGMLMSAYNLKLSTKEEEQHVV